MEVGTWELATPEAKEALAEVEEGQRQSRILDVISKRLQQIEDPLRALSWAIQWDYKSVRSKNYKKTMYDQYVAGLDAKGLLRREETIRPTAELLLEMKKAGRERKFIFNS